MNDNKNSKDIYFADYTNDVDYRRSKQKNKKHKGLKVVLVMIGIAAILLTAVWAVLRYVYTDFYFSEFIPDKQIAAFVDERIIGRTTTSAPISPIVTETKPLYESMTYLDDDNFDFHIDNKGSLVGNILNGGKICASNGYVYHIVDGRGIYRFDPNSEDYSLVLSVKQNISSLNVFSNKLYFVDDDDHTLCLGIINGSIVKIADDVSVAYVYGKTAYCISNSNKIKIVDVVSKEQKVLFSGEDMTELSLVGISSSKVFFTVSYRNDKVEYLVADLNEDLIEKFMPDSSSNRIMHLSMEDGFMYYSLQQDDGAYDLVRQKFGSPKVVTLKRNVNLTECVVVDFNRAFYAEIVNGNFCFREYNMNTDNLKTMLCVNKVGESPSLSAYHGGEFDYIIGVKSDGTFVYMGSSSLTSSTNVMTFDDGKWSY